MVFSSVGVMRLDNVRFTSVRARIDLSDITISGRNHDGDFNPNSLAQAINTDTINNVVVRAWIDRASKLATYIFLQPSFLITSLS